MEDAIRYAREGICIYGADEPEGVVMRALLRALAAQPAEPVARFLSSCEHVMWMRGGAWFGGTIADLRIVADAPPQASVQGAYCPQHGIHYPCFQCAQEQSNMGGSEAADAPQKLDSGSESGASSPSRPSTQAPVKCERCGKVDGCEGHPWADRATHPSVEDERGALLRKARRLVIAMAESKDEEWQQNLRALTDLLLSDDVASAALKGKKKGDL